MATTTWRVREIVWKPDLAYGTVGYVGDLKVFAFYYRSLSKDDTTNLRYVLEPFLPGANKWFVQDKAQAAKRAAIILSTFIDQLTET